MESENPFQDTINNIRTAFPNVYESSKELVVFEQQVRNIIDDRYGKDTLENIMKFQEYAQEQDNVNNGILKDTMMSRLAQRKQALFERYSRETFKMAQEIGLKDSLLYMDILTTYFKSIINLLI